MDDDKIRSSDLSLLFGPTIQSFIITGVLDETSYYNLLTFARNHNGKEASFQVRRNLAIVSHELI